MVLGEERAGRAEAANNFHSCLGRLAAPAEELVGLEFVQGVFLIVLAVLAVLPADCPVLFGIFDRGFVGFKHDKKMLVILINRSFYRHATALPPMTCDNAYRSCFAQRGRHQDCDPATPFSQLDSCDEKLLTGP
jgi:hypothetical protein